MGLFTGMSVISIFEFLYWMFRPSRIWKIKIKDQDNEEGTKLKTTEVTRAGSLYGNEANNCDKNTSFQSKPAAKLQGTILNN